MLKEYGEGHQLYCGGRIYQLFKLLTSGFLGWALLSQIAFAQLPQIQESNGVTYLSGGIGLDESQAIQSAAKNWPLEIILSSLGPVRAEWVSDVSLEIKDARGVVVLNVISDGPLVLLKLEPGDYSLNATYMNKTVQRSFQIKAGQSQRISVYWRSQ